MNTPRDAGRGEPLLASCTPEAGNHSPHALRRRARARLSRAAGAILLIALAGCGTPPDAHVAPGAPTAAADHAGHLPPGSVALTDAMRANLGITFAKVASRIVQGTVRLPGRFEAEPSARRAYQTPLAGRVEVLVKPYQRVAAGEALYRLSAPEWRRLQQELAVATAAVTAAEDALAALTAHRAALDEALKLWQGRLADLDRLGQEVGGTAGARAEIAAKAAELRVSLADNQRLLAEARRQAQGADGHAECGQARTTLRLLLQSAAQLSGETVEQLVVGDAHGVPRWSRIETLAVTATGAGVVEGEVATTGSWLEAHAPVLTVTDITGVRLRASALQADLPRLRDGMTARITAHDPADPATIPVQVVIAPVADHIDRSVDLIARPTAGTTLPAWIRPGVTALLELVVRGNADEELAIPLGAVAPDGLVSMFFRRDPKDPAVVKRIEADLGVDDGRWVVVNSGVKEGDEVVLGGLHALKLALQAASGGPAKKADPHANCGGH